MLSSLPGPNSFMSSPGCAGFELDKQIGIKKHVLAAQRLYVTKTLIALPAVLADQLLEGAGQADNSPHTGLIYKSTFATSCLWPLAKYVQMSCDVIESTTTF